MNQIADKINSVLPVSLRKSNAEEVREYFKNSWELYELLFSSIIDDSTYYESPDPLRNPLIFYYGHTAAFYVNKFKLAGLVEEGVNEHFEDLFARGVDPDLPENLKIADIWPSVAEVRAYRSVIFELVNKTIDEADFAREIGPSNPLWSLHMGIEHDRIHFETSSVLIRQLEENLVRKPDGWSYAPTLGLSEDYEWISVKGETVHLGRSADYDLFGWDNEFGSKEVKVEQFQATKNLVTNSDYFEFVKESYNDEQFWTTEGWEWKNRVQSTYPKFWLPSGHSYEYRAMFDTIPLPLDWPVEVNAFEAQAYCNWKGNGVRLLTEAEFRLIEKHTYSIEPFLDEAVNINIRFGSPTPVGFANSKEGFNDVFGNVWDWLSDNFESLEGFKVHSYYEDFSEPYFGKEHGMMLGGSWATSGTGASKYYRLWFRRNFYQHAGFRLAKDL